MCNSTLGALLDEPGVDARAVHSADIQSDEASAAEPQFDPSDEPGVTRAAAAGLEAAAEEEECGIAVSRGRAAAGASGDEEVEFQGCGVPSAFADPAGFGGDAAVDDDGCGGDGPEDRLGDLPRRTLTLRPSGMRVRPHPSRHRTPPIS